MLLRVSRFKAIVRQLTDLVKLLSIYMFDIRFRVSCLHLVNSSVRLFNSELTLFFMIVSFSSTFALKRT